jgi:hypothetical protein
MALQQCADEGMLDTLVPVNHAFAVVQSREIPQPAEHAGAIAPLLLGGTPHIRRHRGVAGSGMGLLHRICPVVPIIAERREIMRGVSRKRTGISLCVGCEDIKILFSTGSGYHKHDKKKIRNQINN